MKIGILALQGAFIEHEKMLSQLGVDTFLIRQRKNLMESADGYIIPGGESTVQGKLLRELGMFEDFKSSIENGMPVFGTCAGLILLAKKIEGQENSHLGTMNIVAKRNAYGRQLGSFSTFGDFGNCKNVPMTFIRAPYIESVGEGVEILSTADGKIVSARDGNQLVTAFHPELNSDMRIHEYFVDMIHGN